MGRDSLRLPSSSDTVFSILIPFLGVLGVIAASAQGEARMFLILQGADPNTTTPGVPVEITVLSGHAVTLDVFLEDTDPEALRAYQITMPCAADGGTAGSVEYVPPPFVDTGRADYVFVGFVDIWVPGLDPCPGDDPKVANVVFQKPPAGPVVTDPKYLAEFTYSIAPDARGDFIIDFVCLESDGCKNERTFLRNLDNDPISLTADGMILHVVECVSSSDCDDGLFCTGDETCVDNECQAGMDPCTDPLKPACDDINDQCSPDCNDNGIADNLDIEQCTGAPTCDDCNINFIPDECDILNGTSLDENPMDDIPDECCHWTGAGGDDDWDNRANWSCGVPPDNTEQQQFKVTIDEKNVVVSLTADVAVDSVRLLNGALLDAVQGDLAIESPCGILNDANLIIRDGFAIVGADSFPIFGSQPIQLDGPSAAIISTMAGNTITNQTKVRGFGMIDADFVNEGIVSADVRGAALTVQGLYPKINAGLFEAVDDGVLILCNTSVAGSGIYRADGGTIRVKNVAGAAATAGESTTTGESLDVVNGGIFEVDGDVDINITGTVLIDSGGIYRPDPLRKDVTTASLTAAEVDVRTSQPGGGGRMVLSDLMHVTTTESFTVNGTCPESALLGCTPPVLDMSLAGSVSGGSMNAEGGGVIQVADQAVIYLNGIFSLASGAIYQPDPDRTKVSTAFLSAAGVSITTSPGTAGGRMIITDAMTVQTTGSPESEAAFLIDGICPASLVGCTPPVLGMSLDGEVVGTTMSVLGGAEILMADAASINLTGAFSLGSGAVYQADPKRVETTAALLSVGSVSITTAVGANGTRMVLTDQMKVETTGSPEGTDTFVIDGTCPGSPLVGCTPPVLGMSLDGEVVGTTMSVLGGAEILMADAASISLTGSFALNGTCAGGQAITGCTPPVLFLPDMGQMAVGGDFVIIESAEVTVGGASESSATGAGLSIRVGGDFDNRSTAALIFDWADGPLTLDGGTQTFEVAGLDLGPTLDGLVNNFAMGTLEIAGGSSTTIVDAFDNAGNGSDDCTEALYVDTVILRAGANVTLTNANVYYVHLDNEGVTPLETGCGQFVQICVSASDCDDQDSCTCDRCEGGLCTFSPTTYGNVNCDAGDVVDLDDILCVIAGFSAFDACPDSDIAPCGGNSVIDLDDILAVIGAFGGADSCCAAG